MQPEGYLTNWGYTGWVHGEYRHFETEEAYLEMLKEVKNCEKTTLTSTVPSIQRQKSMVMEDI